MCGTSIIIILSTYILIRLCDQSSLVGIRVISFLRQSQFSCQTLNVCCQCMMFYQLVATYTPSSYLFHLKLYQPPTTSFFFIAPSKTVLKQESPLRNSVYQARLVGRWMRIAKMGIARWMGIAWIVNRDRWWGLEVLKFVKIIFAIIVGCPQPRSLPMSGTSGFPVLCIFSHPSLYHLAFAFVLAQGLLQHLPSDI